MSPPNLSDYDKNLSMIDNNGPHNDHATTTTTTTTSTSSSSSSSSMGNQTKAHTPNPNTTSITVANKSSSFSSSSKNNVASKNKSTTNTATTYHTYAFDAAELMDQCVEQLEEVIQEASVRCGGGSSQTMTKNHTSTTTITNAMSKYFSSTRCLYEMKEVLAEANDHLMIHMKSLCDQEKENVNIPHQAKKISHEQEQEKKIPVTTSASLLADQLRSLMETKRKQQQQQGRASFQKKRRNFRRSNSSGTSSIMGTTPIDSLLFRLIVILQLCLIRIDDARVVITGRRRRQEQRACPNTNKNLVVVVKPRHRWNPGNVVLYTSVAAWVTTHPWVFTTTTKWLYKMRFLVLGSYTTFSSSQQRHNHNHSVLQHHSSSSSIMILSTTARIGMAAMTLRWFNQKWSTLWMSTKIVGSTEELKAWNQQWIIATYNNHNNDSDPYQQQPYTYSANPTTPAMKRNLEDECKGVVQQKIQDNAERTQRLIDYALHHTAKYSFWHSQGELRFLLLKRAMDVFYASVGTAVDYTGSSNSTGPKGTTMAIAAAASYYYSLTGASQRAAEATSSAESARHLIQHAWGMVSLPGIKTLSLQASRLLKGAAVADRIEIAGVPCFVLSADPAPELAAAIQQSHRQYQQMLPRKPSVSKRLQKLSTIEEDQVKEELLLKSSSSKNLHSTATTTTNAKPFARSYCTTRSYRQRDVILHLTGGGFFAHIIASDLPYLLDWSASTGAVVICPEYALLPEHIFPVALEQVERVYKTLVSTDDGGDDGVGMPTAAQKLLGFEVNRMVVTGESVGGNLAAALCVKIGMENHEQMARFCEASYSNPLNENTQMNRNNHNNSYSNLPLFINEDPSETQEDESEANDSQQAYNQIRMPDALMLSCPVLNLSLEMSHSRAVGTDDPVLPSGLISAISDAYLPNNHVCGKKHPLASPFYASDKILCQFPTTLLFASSTDPLLDDSVVFNQRLRDVGVQSDLFAAQHLPHAYLGLGTAGFPEAQQVQDQCAEWLNHQFGRTS